MNLRINEHRRSARVLQEIHGARLFLQALAFLCVCLLPVAAYSQAPLFTFAQISDSQPATAADQSRFEWVLDTIVAGGNSGALIPYPVSFVMFAGDLVNDPSNQNEWTTWLNTINTRLTANGIPYRAVPGNHDWNSTVGFTNYQTYIGSSAVWETGSNSVVGHNGLTVTTGWYGLDFIGLNNSNGGANKVSSADVSLIDLLASQAAGRSENIFLLAHHPHNESNLLPLLQTLNNTDVVGYMHGHSGSPRAILGLSGIANPNVWELNSQSITSRAGILYYEVYPSEIVVYPIQLTLNSTSLPAPKTIPLVHPMVPAGPPVAPTANFKASPLSGSSPLTVAFTDQSAGLPTSWAWDFGDGSGSTLRNPTHQYTTEGLQTVTLVATNSQGTNELSRYNYINVTVPPPGSTFVPVADSKVNFSSVSKNYGTEGNLRVRGGSSAWNSYLKFNVVGLGGSVQSAKLRLYVTDGSNDGGTLFRVSDTSWSETGITFANAPPFGASLGNAGATSVGQWVEFDVTSAVTGEGPVSFGLSSSSTNSGYFDSREGAFSPELVVLTGDPVPDITLNPLSHNYGSVALGQSASTAINIKNDGGANLSISGLSLAGPDSAEFGFVDPGAFVLAAGASQNVQASFTPSSVALNKSASLSIASDDPDEPFVEVSLQGAGALLEPDISVTPTTHNFGSVTVTQSRSQNVVIKNDGTFALNVTSTDLSGPDLDDFSVSNGGAFSLAPGASRTLQVGFNPSSEGTQSAVLDLVSDDPDEALVAVNLSGTGTLISTANISLEEVKTGGSSGAASVSTATALTAADGHVYLASISSKSFQNVSAVNGLGLVWTRLSGQCGGRNQTGVSIWTATGTPSASSSVVTAAFPGIPSNAVIAVTRYSGVGSLGGLTSANSNGTGGACSGGLDSSSYGVNLTTTGANSLVYAAVAMRGVKHTAGGGFVERVLVAQGSTSGTIASVAGMDQVFGAPGVVGVAGTFSGLVDWAVAAVELRP